MGNIIDLKGKAATPGKPCIYHLSSGVVLYSETAREDNDSYVFEAGKTMLIAVEKVGNKAQMQGSRMTEWLFSPSQIRVHKSFIAMITDCGEPELVKKFQAGLSGLVAPGAMN